jgi:hypothetical protein
MTIKKTLHNRIRGWFPHEPYLLSTQVKVDCEVNNEIKHPPPMIPQDYTVSATKTARNVAVLWIFLYGFFSLIWLSTEPVNITLLVAWIIVGAAVGIISGKKYTQNQLRRLSKEVQIYPNKKDMIFVIVPLLLVLPFGFLVSWFLFDALIRPSRLFGVLVSVYAYSASQQVARYAIFRGFERKQDMRIMTGWLGGGIAVIPKPPNNNVNRLEAAAEQRH